MLLPLVSKFWLNYRTEDRHIFPCARSIKENMIKITSSDEPPKSFFLHPKVNYHINVFDIKCIKMTLQKGKTCMCIYLMTFLKLKVNLKFLTVWRRHLYHILKCKWVDFYKQFLKFLISIDITLWLLKLKILWIHSNMLEKYIMK